MALNAIPARLHNAPAPSQQASARPTARPVHVCFDGRDRLPRATRACEKRSAGWTSPASLGAMDVLSPPKAVAGDRVAVVSPSFAAPGFAPAVHEQAMERLT